VAEADIVVFAVPDLALQAVTAELVPRMKDGAIALTLDPAAAYVGLLTTRPEVIQAVAHPCHPSIFLRRTTPEEYADTFGGIAAPQAAPRHVIVIGAIPGFARIVGSHGLNKCGS
jgi:D-apionate oxidoisomerase